MFTVLVGRASSAQMQSFWGCPYSYHYAICSNASQKLSAFDKMLHCGDNSKCEAPKQTIEWGEGFQWYFSAPRSFPVAAARDWNALPQHVRNASSLSVFRRELKTVLFRSSFPDAIWQCTVLYLRARRSVLICHHLLAATNWFCWHCTVVLQQQCDNTT